MATNTGEKANPHKLSLFSCLDVSTRKRLAQQCKSITLTPGESIFTQGETHDRSYIIESGLVRTYYIAESGREITLCHWSDGDLVGGPFLFGSGIHVWSCVVIRESRLLSITGRALQQFASENTELYAWIVDVLSFKLLWLSILFQVHGTEKVQQRLVKLLLMLGDLYGTKSPSGTVIKHIISQQNLASLVGASRQWTNKNLCELSKGGYIARKDRLIILRDIPGLKLMLREQGS